MRENNVMPSSSVERNIGRRKVTMVKRRVMKFAMTALVALMNLAVVSGAQAALVTLRADGTVTFVDDGDGLVSSLLGTPPAVGSPMSISFTYETTTPDFLSAAPNNGVYEALRTLNVEIGATQFGTSFNSPPRHINIYNDLPLGSVLRDAFFLATSGFQSPNGLFLRPDVQMVADGTVSSPPTAFTSDQLPIGAPDISLFTLTKGINLQINPTSNDNRFDVIRASLDAFYVVVTDVDGDGIVDADDNCSAVANTDQTDTEHDGVGDACDIDDDNDNVQDGADNCPMVANASQSDSDGDGVGNACDGDLDGDGFANELDNCPAASNTDQTDTDQDGLGDECDTDDDGDGLQDADDNCPAVQNAGQDDLDGDGIGDSCDSDLDGDGVENTGDNCPIDANVGQDNTDDDPLGDACDPDADNDNVSNASDNCPLVANPNQSDSDHDGAGNACDSDLDGDGAGNGVDNCPTTANSGQTDLDGDGQGDACDDDADGDGVDNGTDECAATTIGAVTDPLHGCSIIQLCPCEGPRGTVMPWRNHGKYVSCVAHAAGEFEVQGLISAFTRSQLVSAAGQSSCGT